jgi:hypothetical protein
MKREVIAIAAIAIAAVTLPRPGHATSPFDQRLEPEQQIVHALNRLTFGPRPGDVEEVRRVGLAKWWSRNCIRSRLPKTLYSMKG